MRVVVAQARGRIGTRPLRVLWPAGGEVGRAAPGWRGVAW
jgi:hypothetical protein